MSNSSNFSAGRLYRILDFSRAVQIFESNSLYFAHPQSWEDPYELSIRHQSSHALFAQCWCQLGVSDAMWRIYSPHHMGVRISTSTRKLSSALSSAIKTKGYSLVTGPVEYLSQHNIRIKNQTIEKELKTNFNIETAVKALYMKREAFMHESEWRATIYCPDADPRKIQKGILVPVNPHKLIDNILLDPRAPEELVKAFKFYFENKLNFKGSVKRSALYKSPQQNYLEV